jgi:diguanylate cyclase (GGDEF)-like protein
MEVYTTVVIMSSFALLVAIVSLAGNGYMDKRKKIILSVVMSLIIAANFAEWLPAYLDELGGNGYNLIKTISKFIELSLAPAIPLLVAITIGSSRFEKYAWIPIGLNIVLQIVSVSGTGCVFVYDPMSGAYSRGFLYYLYVGFLVLEALYVLLYVVLLSRHYQNHGLLFLLGIATLVIGGVAVQLFVPKIRLDWTCAAIGIILFYVYYNSLVSQVDPLTGLFNRRSLDVRKNHLRNPCVIIFLDVDYFKEVNDDYGHQVGDQILASVTGCLRHVYGKFGECYRFGGDEFCVILTKEYDKLDAINKKFVAEIKSARLLEERLPYVSFGSTLFDPKTETIDQAFEKADRLMYQQKRLRKSEGTGNPPPKAKKALERRVDRARKNARR